MKAGVAAARAREKGAPCSDPEPKLGPWVMPWPRLRILMSAGLVGTAVFGASLTGDAVFHSTREGILLSDAFAALAATVLTFQVLRNYSEQHEIAEEHLRMLGWVNRRVRDALARVLDSTLIASNAQLMQVVQDAARSLDLIREDAVAVFGLESDETLTECLLESPSMEQRESAER